MKKVFWVVLVSAVGLFCFFNSERIVNALTCDEAKKSISSLDSYDVCVACNGWPVDCSTMGNYYLYLNCVANKSACIQFLAAKEAEERARELISGSDISQPTARFETTEAVTQEFFNAIYELKFMEAIESKYNLDSVSSRRIQSTICDKWPPLCPPKRPRPSRNFGTPIGK